MDKLKLLQQKKQEILASGKAVRDFISEILDEYSFVELDTYAFSKGDDFSGDSYGQGVVSGHGTVDGIPVCVAAQNFAVNKGGVSKAHAEKILKCQKHALNTGSVMISIIESAGASLPDGIAALEGYAEIITQANEMYGQVPQIAVIKGQSLGSVNYFAALHDFVIMLDGSVAATASPAAILAKSDLAQDAGKAFGARAHSEKTGFAAFTVKDGAELGEKLKKLLYLLSCEQAFDTDTAALNADAPVLNSGYNAKEVIESVFDADTFFELYKDFGAQLVTGFAKIGGITVGALLCADKPEGCTLCGNSAKKAAKFIRLLDRLNLPLISFVNTSGVELSVETEQSSVINDIASLMSAVSDCGSPKISVICGKAVGAGYIALSSKSLGFDNSVAWATSVVSAIDTAAGGIIEYSEEISAAKDPVRARAAAQQKFADINADPFHAAAGASVDDVIEPAFTRQYLLSLLMLHV